VSFTQNSTYKQDQNLSIKHLHSKEIALMSNLDSCVMIFSKRFRFI